MNNPEIKNYILIGESPSGYSYFSGERFSIESSTRTECKISSEDGRISFNVDPEVVFNEKYISHYADNPDKPINADLQHDLLYKNKNLKKVKPPQAIFKNREN